jgi:serine/threonine protein kinase
MMIEENDILFLSNGDDFIPPRIDGGSVLYMKNRGVWETIPSVISGYKIGKVLGRGGFGEVRVGEHQLTHERVALKFLCKAEIISMGAAERTTTEIQCLSALRHANIIRLQQVFLFFYSPCSPFFSITLSIYSYSPHLSLLLAR